MSISVSSLENPTTQASPATRWMGSAEKESVFEGATHSGVTLYSEAELISLSNPHHGGLSRLMRDLLAATSARQRESAIRERLDDMSFEWMGYYTVSQQPGGAPRRAFLTTYTQRDWVKRYFDEHYEDVDPRQVRQPRSTLPLTWDIAYLDDCAEARPPSPRTRRFISELQDTGMFSGVFLRIPSQAHSTEQTMISLVSSAPNRRWIADRVLGEALAFSLSLHDYMSQHVRIPAEVLADGTQACGVAAGGLPALQQAVLSLVVHGLTDREIAQRLQISGHTVDYHLRQLRQRFAVHNRVQLASAAAHMVALV
jgi:DNA-binding CsgD family transcriptional regulator